MTNYERFKEALKEYEEKRFLELKEEIRKIKNFIEEMLTAYFESSTSQASCNYPIVNMH